MMTTDEAKFYQRLRSRAVTIGVRINRLENEVEPGWPDVLVRGDEDLHIWLELKIGKGPKGRIKVRPEQINWIEEHGAAGGVAWVLAQNERQLDCMWLISHRRLRRCAREGCLGQKYIRIKDFGQFLRRRMGQDVNLQSANPASAKVRSGLDFTPKRGIVRGAFLP